MRKAVAVLILGLIVPVLAGAQELASLEQKRQTAEQGNADAQMDMGILYEFGYHMPKNDINALAWYMRAADQGNELAAKRRDLLQSHMKPDEIDAARQLSSSLATVKKQSAVTEPAVDKNPITSEAAPPAQPAAAMPSSPVAETPPAAEPAGAVAPSAEPAGEKPSSSP